MKATIHQPAAAQRRSRSREARDAFPPMGIYAVRDGGSGRVLVGSARDVHARLRRMQFELRLGTHPDKDLQSAWRQDPTRFSFEVLELVKQRTDAAFDYSEELRMLEQLYRGELCEGPLR